MATGAGAGWPARFRFGQSASTASGSVSATQSGDSRRSGAERRSHLLPVRGAPTSSRGEVREAHVCRVPRERSAGGGLAALDLAVVAAQARVFKERDACVFAGDRSRVSRAHRGVCASLRRSTFGARRVGASSVLPYLAQLTHFPCARRLCAMNSTVSADKRIVEGLWRRRDGDPPRGGFEVQSRMLTADAERRPRSPTRFRS